MSNEESTSKFPAASLWGLITGVLYLLFVRPQLLRWGTLRGESERRLPGDELIPTPNMKSTRAIDIDAPPEAVWPWVAQMGRDRTGWYSVDLLDNNGIPSATYIRKDLSEPMPGMEMDLGFRVLEVESHRKLVIGGYDLPNRFGASTDVTILFLLERKSDGGTRLITRLRAYSYGSFGRFHNLLLEPIDFFMNRQQLEGLKARAETMAHLKITAPVEHEISLN